MENQNPKNNRWNKYLMGIGIAIMTLVTTYLVHTNPALNLADLTNTGVTGSATDYLYMPTYTGGVGESGLIEIKTKEDLPTFDSITFSLKYSPVNALIFENNPIIFDTDTQFQNAAFQMTAQPEAGKLIVTVILDDPIDIMSPPSITPGTPATHKTLFKLNTKLNPALSVGQVVNVTFEDLALLDGSTVLTTVPAMPATTITVAGQNELKVLSAQAIDSTHVAIGFSDYLSAIGVPADYVSVPALVPTTVESGVNYGYDQKYVVLTTPIQTAGTKYIVTVGPAITSNQQGTVNATFSKVPFYGFGQIASVLSDFGMASATVTGYNSIAVTFTHPVKTASVTKTDFNLAIQGGGAVTVDNVTSVSGSTVNLAVSTPLLKDNTYLLSSVTPSSILRDSDGAALGVDRVAFAGALNGPRLLTGSVANVGGVYRLTLTFDENIKFPTPAIPNNPVGYLYTTGTTAGVLIDDLAPQGQTISGKTLTIDNVAFNNANANFTFSVSNPAWLVNSLGVPVDDTYKTISFWGLGHSDSTNSVGTVSVTKKDAFRIPKGTLNFANVSLSDISVLYDNPPPPVPPVNKALSTSVVSSIGLVGTDLEVVMGASLNPDRHYVVRIADHTVPTTTLAAKDFAITRELNIVSAQAVSAATTRVTFSENIDERSVDASDFEVEGAAATFMTTDPGYKSLVLTHAVRPAGSINKVALSGTGLTDLYSYDGNASLKKVSYFTGFQTQSAQSPVILSSVDVIDSQTLRFNFSGAVDQASITPINLDIFWLSGVSNPLVVTGVTQVDADTYELKTAIQNAGMNYFVAFNGVKDSNGLTLGNTKISNFFGFQLPAAAISLVTPNTVTNDLASNVVLSGSNLDIVKEVRLNNKAVTIVNQTANSLTFAVPVGFEAQQYNITLIDKANNSLVFNNALLVTLPTPVLTVRSEQSQSLPYNVPNDGVTKTKLWLLVEDPVNLNNVSSVVVDLTQIGGPATQEMKKDTGTQPQFSQWYTYETTIPVTVATKDAPYLLPVEVRKGSEKYAGTVSIRVTKDVLKGVAPKIDHVYISPISVSPDGTTPVRISAQVTDQDGAVTINSVVADLGSLGLGFKPLVALSEVTAGTELETQFFQTEEFTVPKTTQLGDYTINVVASDITGEKTTATLTLQVSTLVTGPKIDADVSYISPRKSIPRDAKTEFSIHAFVSDPDGVSDIQTVTANFPSLGLAPVALTKDAAAATEGKSAWFQVTGLTVPKIAPLGVHDIEIRATDSQGGMANLILRIEVTHKDTLGEPPRVVDDRGYTTPRAAINDGQTPITLYAFVQDDDGDIESVVANLSEIGQVGPETGGTLGGTTTTTTTSGGTTTTTTSASGSCPTGSNVLVCMNPSVKEGANGQWFILPGVTVSKLTSPSPNPYQVEVTVTDSGGKSAKGTIPVYVGSGDSISDQQEPPKILAAIPTSDTTVEVLFSKEMSASSIGSSGKGFTITSESNINEILPIIGATINSSGTVVTLSTSNQVPGKRYVLSVSKDIKDIVGRSVIEGSASRLNFSGFQALDRAPILEYIEATDVNMVELEFRDNLKPSSVRTGMSQTDMSSQLGVSIYESDNTSQRLDILGVTLVGPKIIRVKTGSQVADMKYRITIEGLASADGTALPVAINKGFKGYNLTIVQHRAAAGLADLNGDGKVDFLDFTIFSSVYGTIYSGTGENLAAAQANAAAQAASAAAQAAAGTGQPLTPNPNATVPITSSTTTGTTTTTTTTQTPQ